MMKQNSSGWIQTLSGNKFYYLRANVEDISIEDIANGLACICRFAGQVPVENWYSVAQHSVNVSNLLPTPELQLYGLLHDASEALTNDFPTPLKKLSFMEGLRKLEKNIQANIYQKYGLAPEEPEEVKRADLTMLATEYRDLIPIHKQEWWDYLEQMKAYPRENKIVPLSPKEAKILFLKKFNELIKQNAK